MTALLFFFGWAWLAIYRGWRSENDDVYRSALLRYGVMLLPALLVDQVRLEFNRPAWIDFTQFVLALTGLLVGVADRVQPGTEASQAVEQQVRQVAA